MRRFYGRNSLNMPKKTIIDAIKESLIRQGQPMRVQDIYKRIKEDDLYRFNAANPEHIVRTQLRRHSDNLDFPTAHKSKYFVFLEDGSYWLKDQPYHREISKVEKLITHVENTSESTYSSIKELHNKYTVDFRNYLLKQLMLLDPYLFEEFCKRLLLVYGFKNVKVTSKSKDGGIDGHGDLKIGLAYMRVAFECKRYSNKTIGRPLVNQFRGDIQGTFEQGIFFTTSKFTADAKSVSFKPGAVPIVLMDGRSIVDLMIDKGFGVEKEMLPIYTSAIDLVLDN